MKKQAKKTAKQQKPKTPTTKEFLQYIIDQIFKQEIEESKCQD